MKLSRVYMAVEPDEYECPFYIGELKDFCRHLLVGESTVYKAAKSENQLLKTRYGRFKVRRLDCTLGELDGGEE